MLDGSAGELSVSVDLQDSASQFAGWKDMGSRRFLLFQHQGPCLKGFEIFSGVQKENVEPEENGQATFLHAIASHHIKR